MITSSLAIEPPSSNANSPTDSSEVYQYDVNDKIRPPKNSAYLPRYISNRLPLRQFANGRPSQINHNHIK